MPLIEATDSRVEDALQRLGSRLGGDFRAGQRLPAVRQLANDLSVSPPTLYRAIRELVNHGYLVTRARQGVYVSDKFSDARLQSLFADQTSDQADASPFKGKRAILFIPNDSTHMWPALEVVSRELPALGCEVIRGDYHRLSSHQSQADYQGKDIIILINPDVPLRISPQPGQHVVVISSAAGLPHLDIPAHAYDLVSVEQEQGSSLAGQYLRASGCASVAFLGVFRGQGESLQMDLTSYLRLHGFEQGWGEAVNPDHQLSAAGYSQIWGAKAAKVYARMNPRPRGIFAVSDDLAIGMINGLTALGLELDHDYQLVGFDGQRQLMEISSEVCCVTVPATAMGEQAVQLLLSRIAKPDQPLRKVLLGCSLNRSMPGLG